MNGDAIGAIGEVPVFPRAACLAALALLLSACSVDRPALSNFAEGTPVTAGVVENSTACVVDAVCFLRLELADTTVLAVYGSGERPAPPCDVPVEVSDLAFTMVAGSSVVAVLERCSSELYLKSLREPDASEG